MVTDDQGGGESAFAFTEEQRAKVRSTVNELDDNEFEELVGHLERRAQLERIGGGGG